VGERVLVHGVNTPIGLTVVRELGKNGVEVYGIGASRRAVGLYSRYLSKGFVFTGDHEALLAFIRELAERHDIGYLLAVGESDLQFFNANRERLLPMKCLFPDAERLERDRCESCVFMTMTRDGPISMCVHNARRDDFILQPVQVTTGNGTRLWDPLEGQRSGFAKLPEPQSHGLKRVKGRTRATLLAERAG